MVALELGAREVGPGDHLVEDLGVSSMELVGILATVQDRWGLAVSDLDLTGLSTVADLHSRILSGSDPDAD